MTKKMPTEFYRLTEEAGTQAETRQTDCRSVENATRTTLRNLLGASCVLTQIHNAIWFPRSFVSGILLKTIASFTASTPTNSLYGNIDLLAFRQPRYAPASLLAKMQQSPKIVAFSPSRLRWVLSNCLRDGSFHPTRTKPDIITISRSASLSVRRLPITDPANFLEARFWITSRFGRQQTQNLDDQITPRRQKIWAAPNTGQS